MTAADSRVGGRPAAQMALSPGAAVAEAYARATDTVSDGRKTDMCDAAPCSEDDVGGGGGGGGGNGVVRSSQLSLVLSGIVFAPLLFRARPTKPRPLDVFRCPAVVVFLAPVSAPKKNDNNNNMLVSTPAPT